MKGLWVLRRAMAGLLAAGVVGRRKQGFSPPEGSWYRGESVDCVKEVRLDPRNLGRGYFQPAFIRRVLDEHAGGRVNRRRLIWSLLCFEWWNRVFVEGERPGAESQATGSGRRVDPWDPGALAAAA